MSGNRRGQERLPVNNPSNLESFISVQGQNFSFSISDLSPEGFSGRLDPEAWQQLLYNQDDSELTLGGKKYFFKLSHHREENQGDWVRFGARLIESENSDQPTFHSQSPDWDLLRGKERSIVLGDLILKGPEVLLNVMQKQTSKKVFAVEFQEENQNLICEFADEKDLSLEEGLADIQFDLFQTNHAFRSRLTMAKDGKIGLQIPEKIARVLRRSTFRVLVKDQKLVAEVPKTDFSENKESGILEVVDISEHGISLKGNSSWMHMPIGSKLARIIIKTEAGVIAKGSGKIRSHYRNGGEKELLLGVQFFPEEAAALEAWHSFVISSRYPHLSFAYTDEDHSKIWELFDRSKYLDLKPRESFNYVYDVTKRTWVSMQNAGVKNCRRIMLKRDGDIFGHLQLDRIYPKTWCAHALAIDPKQGKMIGRDIYSITTDVLESENAGYVISITEANLKWNQRNYYDFVKSYPWPEHNDLQTFQIHEAEVSQGWTLQSLPNTEYRWANKWDLKRVAAFFANSLTKIEIDALSLDRDNLELKTLDSDWAKYGLSRERQYLCAYQGDALVGVTIAETGTKGLCIFGIQDTVFPYVSSGFSGLEKDRRLLQEGMLSEVLNWYRSRSIATINIYFKEVEREYWGDRNLKFIWEGVRWIGKCVASRRYNAYTQQLYGHLLLARERRKRKGPRRDQN